LGFWRGHEPQQRAIDRFAASYGFACGTHIALIEPTEVFFKLIDWITTLLVYKTLRQAKCHSGIIGIGSSRKMKFATTLKIGNRRETVTQQKLHRRTECITNSQTKHCAQGFVYRLIGHCKTPMA